jgi:hypothetical protein
MPLCVSNIGRFRSQTTSKHKQTASGCVPVEIGEVERIELGPAAAAENAESGLERCRLALLETKFCVSQVSVFVVL